MEGFEKKCFKPVMRGRDGDGVLTCILVFGLSQGSVANVSWVKFIQMLIACALPSV